MDTFIDYGDAFGKLELRGKEVFGKNFKLDPADKPVVYRLLCYFLKDEAVAAQLGIHLDKGILLTGPIGCGKSSLMHLVRFFQPVSNRFIVKSCRDVSFEFKKDGYDVIQKYSHLSFHNHEPKHYCFDDLGTEKNIKFYGDECNVMGEIILSRYDLFISRKLLTHLTTNLSASEIEAAYGNRVRSRLRGMLNLVSFDREAADKRK